MTIGHFLQELWEVEIAHQASWGPANLPSSLIYQGSLLFTLRAQEPKFLWRLICPVRGGGGTPPTPILLHAKEGGNRISKIKFIKRSSNYGVVNKRLLLRPIIMWLNLTPCAARGAVRPGHGVSTQTPAPPPSPARQPPGLPESRSQFFL